MTRGEDGFGDRLRRAQREAGISQTALGLFVAASQVKVSQWMRGKDRPTPDQQAELARRLGVRVEWLCDGELPIRNGPLTERTTNQEASVEAPPAGSASSGAVREETPVAPAASLVELGSDLGWDFRPAPKDGGKDFGNSNVWSFKPGLDVLVREVLQNARDAAVSTNQMVNVVFRIVTLRGDDLRRFWHALRWSDLVPHLDAASVENQRFNTLLRDGLGRVRDRDELRLLVIEDSGTVGLTGPERAAGNFMALCRNNLDSPKAGGAGGAFGLGKAVLWRASRLFTVLFGSTLSQPQDGRSQDRLIGRCDLACHEVAGRPFAGPGWFGSRATGDSADSVWENRALSDELFLRRDAVGTTACVVGFHDASSDDDTDPIDLAGALLRESAHNFFPALVAAQLAVRVEVYDSGRACRERTPTFVRDVLPEEFMPASVAMLRALQAGKVATQLGDEPGTVAMRTVELVVPRRREAGKGSEQSHRAVLLVMAANDESVSSTPAAERPSHLAMFRGPGMVVQDKSLAGLCLGARPFHALLLCGHAAGRAHLSATTATPEADLAAEEFLRCAEPPSHNEWTSTPDLSSVYVHGCKKRLEVFMKEAADAVRELVKPPTRDTGDGPDALKDLFRIGAEPASHSEKPTVFCTGAPDEAGRWDVKARVRLKAKKTEQRLTPAVYFLGENSGGVPVKWASLAANMNCAIDEGDRFNLIVPPDTRELRFSGTTDPSSHPVPATHSCVSVAIKKLVSIPSGAR